MGVRPGGCSGPVPPIPALREARLRSAVQRGEGGGGAAEPPVPLTSPAGGVSSGGKLLPRNFAQALVAAPSPSAAPPFPRRAGPAGGCGGWCPPARLCQGVRAIGGARRATPTGVRWAGGCRQRLGPGGVGQGVGVRQQPGCGHGWAVGPWPWAPLCCSGCRGARCTLRVPRLGRSAPGAAHVPASD